MKVLVLGGSGMLGHKLCQVLHDRFETYATLRRPLAPAVVGALFEPGRVLGGVAAEDFDSVVRAVGATRPSVVVNCVGIVKQASAAKDPLPSIAINAHFPHRLAALCEATGTRLIHVSTDCVFSGDAGGYTEEDRPDPVDLYGRSKLLGEVDDPHALTLRTSIIGRELSGAYGLVEWFLGQHGGTARGFTRAVFSGLTTLELSGNIAHVIADHPDLSGLWHVAADPINKFDLLSLVADAYGLDVRIDPADEPVIDRSLDGSRFRSETGLVAPGWPTMLERMATDSAPYDELRRATGVHG
jgi:dTDP-4-dehydrorhamnose reductase